MHPKASGGEALALNGEAAHSNKACRRAIRHARVKCSAPAVGLTSCPISSAAGPVGYMGRG